MENKQIVETMVNNNNKLTTADDEEPLTTIETIVYSMIFGMFGGVGSVIGGYIYNLSRPRDEAETPYDTACHGVTVAAGAAIYCMLNLA